MATGDKIPRKDLIRYIEADPLGTPEMVALVVDLEEMNTDMNMEVESKTDIGGGASILITTGTPTTSVEPYYAKVGTAMYTWLQGIIDGNLELDSLKTKIYDVKKWETPTVDAYPAIEEEVYVEIVSYGGDTTGYQIPFNIHHTKIKVEGLYDIVLDTFTAS